MRITVTVNGEPVEADVWEGESLLFALRERMGFPGSKNACEQGECGSCSVFLDGTLVCACLVLAAQADLHEVTTVEGLANGDDLHPVQQAYVETGAVQCGFCTPGLIVSTVDLLRRVPRPDDDQIREALSGNLCRCTGYAKIFDAVRLAAERCARPSASSSSAASASPSVASTRSRRWSASSPTPATWSRPGCSGATRSAVRSRTRASAGSTSRRR